MIFPIWSWAVDNLSHHFCAWVHISHVVTCPCINLLNGTLMSQLLLWKLILCFYRPRPPKIKNWPDRSLVGDLFQKMHSNAHPTWQIAAVGSRRSDRRWGDPRWPAVTLGLREDLRLKFSESQVAAGRRGCDCRSPAVTRGLIVA